MADLSPFHEGERLVQSRAAVRDEMDRRAGRAIRDFMPEQHRTFFPLLSFLVVGSIDRTGQPWASILVGRPGFIQSPDARTLRIAAQPAYGDPLGTNLAIGARLGLLGIQPETRRRNRANGSIEALDTGGFTLHVEQSFGNCAKYIQARAPHFVAAPESVSVPRAVRTEGPVLSAEASALISAADTFFIATAAPGDGADVSHRGGRPGFVRVSAAGGCTTLTVPDFSGNNYFMTLGNIVAEPRASVIFVDFETGTVLTLSCMAEIVWDSAEIAAFAGARRLLRLSVVAGFAITDAVPLRWSAPEYAPQLAATGAWSPT